MAAKTIRTTVSLPQDLLEEADRFVRKGVARSRGEFLSDALRQAIRRLRREEIDERIRAMARDQEALDENKRIQQEFELADREAWEMIDD